MRVCSVCKKTADTRPYGTGGADICIECATATPEAQAATSQRYLMQLDAAANADSVGSVVIGSEDGPKPLKPAKGRRQ